MGKKFTKTLRALLFCAGLGYCAIPASAQAAPALPLGHAGRWITDAHGRVVILHGTNVVFKVRPTTHRQVGSAVTTRRSCARSASTQCA